MISKITGFDILISYPVILHLSTNLFFFLVVLGLELRACTLSHSSSPFCEEFFLLGAPGTICLGWL
jgi:hypothetical protein